MTEELLVKLEKRGCPNFDSNASYEMTFMFQISTSHMFVGLLVAFGLTAL